MTQQVQASVLPDITTIARGACSLIVDLVNKHNDDNAEHSKCTFSLALAGGSTPKRLYELWANKANDAALKEAHEAMVQNSRVHYYFGDVRMVPNDDAASNYAMAHTALLHCVSSERVHEVNVFAPAADAASLYSKLLHTTLSLDDNHTPVFDVVLLGVGPDGHTASIFPGTTIAEEKVALVSPCTPPAGVQPAVERVSVTPRVIQAARHVILMATGADKAWVIDGILAASEKRTPKDGRMPVAALLANCRGAVHILVDEAAGANLAK